jgi:HAMP domain-containing protein
MTMSKREKVLVSIVLVLGVFCLYFLTFLNPKLSELRTLNTDIDNKSIDASNVQMQEQIIAGM